jgi:hypothetical protein
VVSVTRIVESDTIEVNSGDTVRLIGIDTPETKHPSQPVECFGAQATQHATELMGPGTSVRLVYDVERTDRYGRTLAYVYRVADDLFVNLEMVRDGFAVMATYPPNVAHVEAFRVAEQEARSANRDCGVPAVVTTPQRGSRVHPHSRRLHPLRAEAAGTATARTSPPTKRRSGSTRPRAVPARTRTAWTETAMASPARASRDSPLSPFLTFGVRRSTGPARAQGPSGVPKALGNWTGAAPRATPATLVPTRFVLLSHLPNGREAGKVDAAMRRAIAHAARRVGPKHHLGPRQGD